MQRSTGAGLAQLVATAIAMTGCPSPPAATAPTTPVELVGAVQGAVQGTIEQWRQAYEVRSMDALARLYAHEPSLVIVQGGALQIGWAVIEPALGSKLAHANAIRVRLKDLQITALGADAASAVAAMTREITDGTATATENGVVTLVLRRTDAGWVITSEHYSYKRP